jgi:hypothetical protein
VINENRDLKARIEEGSKRMEVMAQREAILSK